MLFLDTNILKGVSLRGPEAELLHVLRTVKAERAAAPETVLVELAAQEHIRHQAKLKAVEDALKELRRASPWMTIPPVPLGRPGDAREYWRAQYLKVVDPIKPSVKVYEEALFREANVLPPCKTVGKDAKTGARDAVIWLTAVEYAREHPDEIIRFVSRDSDFRRVTESGRSLQQDIEDLEDRFHTYTTLGEVLAEFATSVTVTAEQVTNLLNSELCQRLTRQRAARVYFRSILVDYPMYEPLLRNYLKAALKDGLTMVLAEVVDPRAYEISGHTWYTADAHWVIACPVPTPFGGDGFFLQRWSNRVMASEAADSEGFTMLKADRLQAAEDDDAELFPGLSGQVTVGAEDLAAAFPIRQRDPYHQRIQAAWNSTQLSLLDLPEADDRPDDYADEYDPDDDGQSL
ncbi:PIN domain-containing protein [Kitasatospora sp. P5_F3]